MTRSSRTAALAFAGDLLLVLAFVLIGRASHDEDPVTGTLVTLWPFTAGLVAGWLITRAWRRPLDPVRSGIGIWIATVVIGMLLRASSGQGVPPAFVIVTAVALGMLVGWRAIAGPVIRRRRARHH